MALRTPQSAATDDPVVLRNYSVPNDRLDNDQVLTGGRWWWSFLALVCLAGGTGLARWGPNRALQGVGVFFLVVGFMNLDGTLRAFHLLVRRHRLRRQFNDQPWTHDFIWDPTGQTDGAMGATIRNAAAGLFWFGACNAYTLALIGGYAPVTAKNIGWCAFGFVISLLFLHFLFIKKTAHFLKFGSSRLNFDRIPYVLGDLFVAQLVPGRSLGAYKKMQFTLRCIQLVAAPNGVTESQVFQVLYADRFELGKGEWWKGMPPLPVQFKLPDQKIPTAISAPLASIIETGKVNPRALGRRYWELEVRATVSGLKYTVSFLVPIYDRPSPAS